MDHAIPVFAMLTGVLTTGAVVWALVRISQGQIGTAVARWIQSQYGHGTDPDLAAELAEVHERVDALQRQLEETQERLDFTERLLASGRRAAAVSEEASS
jgi:hypothetical protein